MLSNEDLALNEYGKNRSKYNRMTRKLQRGKRSSRLLCNGSRENREQQKSGERKREKYSGARALESCDLLAAIGGSVTIKREGAESSVV